MSALSSRLGSTPWKFQGLTGRRKGTAQYCARCETWHPTHRGSGPEGCPLFARDAQDSEARATVYIPRERMGTQRRRVRIPFRVEGVTH